MSRNNTEIRIIRNSMEYGPMPYGAKAGIPTVRVTLSSSDSNVERVGSIENLFNNYNWKQKLRSGFSRFRVGGHEPLSDMHREGIEVLSDLVGARFLDIELDGGDAISHTPSRTIQNTVDSFSLIVPIDRSYDDDAFNFFAERSKNFGDVDFIFKVGKYGDIDTIESVSYDHNIYDSDIYLYPKGRKVSTVSDNLEKCVKGAKKNQWNVSPRMDIIQNHVEDS